jgi:hypothetical protein
MLQPSCHRLHTRKYARTHTCSQLQHSKLSFHRSAGPEVDLADMTPEERLPCLLQRDGREEKNRRLKDFERRDHKLTL